MFFNWLRAQARNAVLAGVADAVAEVEGNDTHDNTTALTLLRSKLVPALTAPTVDHAEGTAAKNKRKPAE